MALDKAVKDSIILSAISGAGPVGDSIEDWEARVLAGSRQITAILGDDTNIFAKAIEEIEESAKFVALVSLVRPERSSTRGLVYFQVLPRVGQGETPVPTFDFQTVLAHHKAFVAARANGQQYQLPEGLECIRTQRTDAIDGYNLAAQASGLVGHRAVFYKINEPIGNGSKNVRVVRLFKDLGKVESYVVPPKVERPAEAAAVAAA
ncbi:hypothetical protein [Leifsonia sp. Leaf264]|uniref:hypothetical protein n=1 Tax=Leifsonia sp. Leaf264 TaxID=1736314 RepID=UPI0007006E42|nr:hypothetical protein [Leifsonia sp. Leaf264]KQO98656.1 hypothetical protein ASF30_11380 [Leifsonia sp. Leaf264]